MFSLEDPVNIVESNDASSSKQIVEEFRSLSLLDQKQINIRVVNKKTLRNQNKMCANDPKISKTYSQKLSSIKIAKSEKASQKAFSVFHSKE